MRYLLSFLYCICFNLTLGQTIIYGEVQSGDQPVVGANISIVNSYDGETSDTNGKFTFNTEEKGSALIKVEKAGFEIHETRINLNQEKIYLNLVLSPIIELNEMIAKVGEKEARSVSNRVELEPFDVVTTAGSMGDNIAALQMQPGTQNNANDGRLFVRGGDLSETQTYIDGLKVYQAYTPSAPQTPTRGRFSPFLFKGIQFSTGGYNIRFGNAMSGVLNMQTINYPKENKFELTLSTVGTGIAYDKVWEKSSWSMNTNFQDLRLYHTLFNSRDEWLESPQNISGESVYRQKFGKALWKTYVSYDVTRLKVLQKNIISPTGDVFGLNNKNIYLNSNITIPTNQYYKLFVGTSYAYSRNLFDINNIKTHVNSQGAFGRVELQTKINGLLNFKSGISVDFEKIKNKFGENVYGSQNLLSNFYSSAQWSVTNDIQLDAGLRASHSSILQKWIWQPRVSLAFQINEGHDVSIIYGNYNQMPKHQFWDKEHHLDFQNTQQLLINYRYVDKRNTFRLELYHKDYNNLITYDQPWQFNYQNVSNAGEGKAKGIDGFWRNNKGLIPNLDFWFSYSYVDSRRIYQDFTVMAQPPYVSKHNVSWVNKYWISALRSHIGITYRFNSGRPYTNPNTDLFLSERNQTYNTVDVGWAYLMSQQKIIYVGINNIFNIQNKFGYRYAKVANQMGYYERKVIVPQNNQFFFIGFFWTISSNKSANQLNKL